MVDIPTRWNPRAKQQQRVAFADFSTASWRGFEKSERGPNNSSLFLPQAVVVVVALGCWLRLVAAALFESHWAPGAATVDIPTGLGPAG